MAAEWDKATSLRELDITATDLATNVIQDILTRLVGRHFSILFQNSVKTKSKRVARFRERQSVVDKEVQLEDTRVRMEELRMLKSEAKADYKR